MPKKTKTPPKTFGQGQDIAKFLALKDELWTAREYGPEVQRFTRQGKVKVVGDILGFVRGLRLSARLIYILRQKIHGAHIDINWGHVLDKQQRMCSPECDIIIHKKDRPHHNHRWNGETDRCVMDFHFVQAATVKAVISCKSKLTSIDADFIKDAKKSFKLKHVLLFAESVPSKSRASLVKKAKKVGYAGLWYLYELGDDGQPVPNEHVYLDFLKRVRKVSD